MLINLPAAASGRLLPVLLAVSAVTAGAGAFANDKITVDALRFTSNSASFIALEEDSFTEAGPDVEFE